MSENQADSTNVQVNNEYKVVAVPSEMPGGLDAPVSMHFGRCECFTVAELENGEWKATIVPNVGEHGCANVVGMLHKYGAQAVVAQHMGMRPVQACLSMGITPFVGEGATVREVVEKLAAGKLPVMDFAGSCQGGGTHSH